MTLQFSDDKLVIAQDKVYIKINANENLAKDELEIQIKQVQQLKYLGTIVDHLEGVGKEQNHRIKLRRKILSSCCVILPTSFGGKGHHLRR